MIAVYRVAVIGWKTCVGAQGRLPGLDRGVGISHPHGVARPLARGADLLPILCCPRCRSALSVGGVKWLCVNEDCVYARLGFPVAGDQPVLIDFEKSIFDRAAYADSRGAMLPRDDAGRGLRTRLRRFLWGSNPVAPRVCRMLLDRAKARAGADRPLILVIGGGAVGVGVAALYRDDAVEIVGTDVYASPYTSIVADGHQLPFRGATIDAVWIQAVLEHVLEPQSVVDEIHRVLKPGGLIYADTPFMQPVHEGAYDFTRFTQSGHRWLLRRFTEIEAGPVGGAGTALLWSMRYFLRALGVPNAAGMMMLLPCVWVHLLERWMDRRANADGAAGVYFLGASTEEALTPKRMVDYYARQKQAEAR